jgi:alkylation response protein AidB-like acyl-CoA dehydrogenase
MFPLPPLTDSQREIVERVGALARERFAPRAARYDAEAAFPYENYADLHAAGLLALTVPREYGGVGADAVAYAHALRAIAFACSATALTFNMHSTVTTFLAALGTAERKARWLGAIVARGARIGSITSEPALEFQ